MHEEVILLIEGLAFTVVHFAFRTRRDVDRIGMPSSEVRVDSIELSIAPDHGSNFFDQWCADSYKSADLEIRFNVQNSSNIFLKEAYLIGYEKTWENRHGEARLEERILLSAREVHLGSGIIEQHWPRS